MWNYPLITFAPGSTHTPSGCSCQGPIYGLIVPPVVLQVLSLVRQRLGAQTKAVVDVSKGIRFKNHVLTKPSWLGAQGHGFQSAHRLGRAALAYHKQKGLTLDYWPLKHCLHHHGKPDIELGVRFGTSNVGSLNGRGTVVCQELRKSGIDVCCLQEVRWRSKGARFTSDEGYGNVFELSI